LLRAFLCIHLPEAEVQNLAETVDPVKNTVPQLGIVGLSITRAVLQLMPDLRPPEGVVVDGVDYRSRATVNSAIAKALRTNVLIYSILFSDATFYHNMDSTGPYSVRIGAAVLKGMARLPAAAISK